MPIAVSATNVMWGVLFVYVARWVMSASEAKSTEAQTTKDFPVEMKDVAVGAKTADVEPRGPFAVWQ